MQKPWNLKLKGGWIMRELDSFEILIWKEFDDGFDLSSGQQPDIYSNKMLTLDSSANYTFKAFQGLKVQCCFLGLLQKWCRRRLTYS